MTFPVDSTQPGQGIAPGATQSILYDTTIPDPAGVGTVYTDTAYVSSYEALTNVPGGGTVTFYPRQNVNLAVLPTQWDAPAASDPSNVRVPGPEVDKSATTSIVETNNDLENEATIGELVTYTYGVRILAGTAAFDGDAARPAAHRLHAGRRRHADLPPGRGQCDDRPGPGRRLARPGHRDRDVPVDVQQRDRRSTSGSQVVLTARVTAAAMSPTQNNLQAINTARFDSLATLGGSALPPATASWTITMRQPRPDVTKSNDSGGPVPGGTRRRVHRDRAQREHGRQRHRPHAAARHVPRRLPARRHDLRRLRRRPRERPRHRAARRTAAPPGPPRSSGRSTRSSRARPRRGPTRRRTPLDAVAGTSYVNNVTLSGSTLDDGKTGPTEPDNADERVGTDTAFSTVPIVGASITKSVTPGPRDDRSGGHLERHRDDRRQHLVLRRLPDRPGPGGRRRHRDHRLPVRRPDRSRSTPCAAVPVRLDDAAGPGGSTIVGWNFGDLPPSTDRRLISVTYTGKIADVPGNVAGVALTNTAHTAWNQTPDSPNDDPARRPVRSTRRRRPPARP